MRLVYDLPTRVFHWSFAGLFLSSILISKFVDSESAVFNYHMLSGLLMLLVILLRVVWGFIGTKHARFSDFDLSPMNLIGYLVGILRGDRKRWVGHNPATSFAAIAMMLTGLGLGTTGLLMTYGHQKERFEDIHEWLSTGFILLVAGHLAGLIIHTIRHREMIAISMVSGSKKDVSISGSILSSRNRIGVAYLLIIIFAAVYLVTHYSSEARTLSLFGEVIQLNKAE